MSQCPIVAAKTLVNAQERLHEAHSAMQEGRYEDAVKGYIWFHKHALEEESGLYGVRLSFALSHWTELGEKYPPARDALLSIRDETASALLSGADSVDLFHDVVSINENLKEPGETTALFLKIVERSPEFAARCSRLAMPALVFTGHYDMARAYLPDPRQALRRIATGLNDDLVNAKSKTEPRFQKLGRWAHLRNFLDDVRLILSIVKRTDSAQSADSLRDELLTQVSDGNARRSLKRYLYDEEAKLVPRPPRDNH